MIYSEFNAQSRFIKANDFLLRIISHVCLFVRLLLMFLLIYYSCSVRYKEV